MLSGVAGDGETRSAAGLLALGLGRAFGRAPGTGTGAAIGGCDMAARAFFSGGCGRDDCEEELCRSPSQRACCPTGACRSSPNVGEEDLGGLFCALSSTIGFGSGAKSRYMSPGSGLSTAFLFHVGPPLHIV